MRHKVQKDIESRTDNTSLVHAPKRFTRDNHSPSPTMFSGRLLILEGVSK